ncbi:MAG: MFS transporter, partial [Alphaproteobacteria bacterium]|nr:MFS transporter [Alphaproteobacteria bacterium]
ALLLAEVIGMAGTSTFVALVPEFTALWHLSAAEAGWISGIYFGGYALAVPFLMVWTDRIDSRRIYFAATILSGVAQLGFALASDGFWSAMLWRGLAGIGLAGTYMPGLRALTDRLEGAYHSRATAWYTAFFGVGASGSIWFTGVLERAAGWQMAAGAAAIGSVGAIVLATWALKPITLPPRPTETRLLDFRPVLSNRQALGYIFAYVAHSIELLGARAWIVAYLVFSAGRSGAGEGWWSATAIATVIGLLGTPASILGNEFAQRFGRARVASVVMTISAVVTVFAGLGNGLAYGWLVLLMVLHGVVIMGDSATLTAGTVLSADPAYRGATMALHTTLGFIASTISPVIFGVILDASGGSHNPTAWAWAYGFLAAATLGGPLALRLVAKSG